MRVFSPSSARHFCSGFSGHTASATSEVDTLLVNLGSPKVVKEGTGNYDALRDCILREAERSIFMAAAKRIAALRALSEATAAWTVVGLYYSCFFSARALLAMHGGVVLKNKRWLEVENSTPGKIELKINKTQHAAANTGKFGSHQYFWKVFYHAAQSIYPFAPATDAHALDPVSASETWLIDARNQYNYKTTDALALLSDFAVRFDATKVPGCFPGTIAVFSNVATALQSLTHYFRRDYGLQSDLLAGRFASIDDAVNHWIRAQVNPALSDHADAVAQTMTV